MPKFDVTMKETIYYDLVVEAEDEEEAEDAAEALFVQSVDPYVTFDGRADERSASNVQLAHFDEMLSEAVLAKEPDIRDLLARALDYVERFAEQNGEPDGGDCRVLLEAIKMAVPRPPTPASAAAAAGPQM